MTFTSLTRRDFTARLATFLSMFGIGGAKLVFDHAGFPGTGEHLFTGWKADYWEPLKKFLASA